MIDNSGRFCQVAESNLVAVPPFAPSTDEVEEKWSIADEQFAQIYALSGGADPSGSSMGLGFGASESIFSPQFGFGSSQMSAETSRDFFFWLDARLVVFGGTDPSAKVTLKGADVKLRPDGTFSAVFELPDGLQGIPAVAESADGVEKRTIALTISRDTERKNEFLK